MTVQVGDAAPFSAEDLAWCQLLPKVELHAHLNGSLRDETIRQLVADKVLTTVTVQDVDNITSKGGVHGIMRGRHKAW